MGSGRARPAFTRAGRRLPQHARMLDILPVHCPYCGEPFDCMVDASGGDADYIEDCPVCCRPIAMRLRLRDAGVVEIEPARED